ncbi:MAG: FKBP-type peptidyl-prolyl cis-trans isomerase [Planctomycetota bacterium]
MQICLISLVVVFVVNSLWGAESAMETNKAAGEAFLAENKKKEGVVTTDSGLQYKALQEGTGEKPKATDKVQVHYRGTTIKGKEFDSSYARKEPIVFALNEVIKGWTEGVQLMKTGAKYQFFIPSDLAYGPRGAPPAIGPNETLIFEVELLAIKK